MSSPWIQHVKQFQQQHGGTYKDAMTLARPSYIPMSGGKFSVSGAMKTLKKGKAGLKTANKLYDQNQQLIHMAVGDETARTLQKARNYSEQADQLTGGKFNLKKAARKAKHTVNTASHLAMPLISTMAPELMPAMMAAQAATGGSFKVHGGGMKKSACQHCGHCGGIPLKPKGYSDPNR